MKRFAVVLTILSVCSCLCFASAAGETAGKVYGYITPGPDTWYQRNVEGFQMGAEKDGNQVVVLNSDYDVSKEIANIDSMINQGVDGLCIFSFNENGAKMAAEKCAAAGIPLVATDSCATVLEAEADVVAAIDFDWVAMGENYAEWMAENHPGDGREPSWRELRHHHRQLRVSTMPDYQ